MSNCKIKKRKVEEITDDNSDYDATDEPSYKKPKLNHTNSQIKNALLTSGEPITLNVGGIKYSTSLTTLSSDPNSILCKMFSGSFSLKPSKDGSYFIDRDGQHFQYILNYLRNSKLNIPMDNILINHLLIESDFYGLTKLNKLLTILNCPSKILNLNEMHQISEWIDEEKSNSYPNWKLLQPYNGSYRSCDLKGIGKLLFIFVVFNRKFGFYMHNIYGLEPSVFVPPISPEEAMLQDYEEEQMLNQMLEEHGPPEPTPMHLQYANSESFVFWFGNMVQNPSDTRQKFDDNFHVTSDRTCSKKYPCYIDVDIDRKEATEDKIRRLGNNNDTISIHFYVDKFKQNISTDLKKFVGGRQYIFDDWSAYMQGHADDFVQHEEIITNMEVFQVGK